MGSSQKRFFTCQMDAPPSTNTARTFIICATILMTLGSGHSGTSLPHLMASLLEMELEGP